MRTSGLQICILRISGTNSLCEITLHPNVPCLTRLCFEMKEAEIPTDTKRRKRKKETERKEERERERERGERERESNTQDLIGQSKALITIEDQCISDKGVGNKP